MTARESQQRALNLGQKTSLMAIALAILDHVAEQVLPAPDSAASTTETPYEVPREGEVGTPVLVNPTIEP